MYVERLNKKINETLFRLLLSEVTAFAPLQFICLF